jgi:hypothetical protein
MLSDSSDGDRMTKRGGGINAIPVAPTTPSPDMRDLVSCKKYMGFDHGASHRLTLSTCTSGTPATLR